MSLRLVVVDADDRTCESIVGLLSIRDRFRVVGSAGHLGAAIRLVDEHRPDVVLMDPRLPEVTGGIALIRAIRGIDPAIRILALGWSPELEHDSLEAGADGFARKTFRLTELGDAITRCMAVAPRPVPPAGKGRAPRSGTAGAARADGGSTEGSEAASVPAPAPGTGVIL